MGFHLGLAPMQKAWEIDLTFLGRAAQQGQCGRGLNEVEEGNKLIFRLWRDYMNEEQHVWFMV